MRKSLEGKGEGGWGNRLDVHDGGWVRYVCGGIGGGRREGFLVWSEVWIVARVFSCAGVRWGRARWRGRRGLCKLACLA